MTLTSKANFPILTADHLARSAFVYIRQSTDLQVRNNVERKRLQYELETHARELGFTSVEVVDDDQGISGSGVRRKGFQRLKDAVCDGTVGLVMAIEASRLARNSGDWQTLLDFCAIVGCLVGDPKRLYDPAVPEDRMYLGLKGQFAAMELAMFRQRSQESRQALAERGELFGCLPAGYEKTDLHHIEKTPDEHQRDAIGFVFRKFREVRSIRQVFLWFGESDIKIPVRHTKHGIQWRVPSMAILGSMLHNPIYAGAYVYGRRRQEVTIEGGHKKVRKGIMKPEEEWTVLLRDRHEGYISWEEFKVNQEVIEANTRGNRGAPRQGRALLAGLLVCGHCQRRMQVADNGKTPRYFCPTGRQENDKSCASFGAMRADAAVSAAVLAMLQPLGISAAMDALEQHYGDESAQIKFASSALEEARYKAARAQAQFDAVDPDNTNIFHNLAARWEACLVDVREREKQLQQLRSAQEARQPSAAEREAWMAMGANLECAWSHERTTPQLRKNILRSALVEITASIRESTVHLLLHWRGGDHTELEVKRNRPGEHRYSSDAETVELITELARQLPDGQIARLLNRLGRKTSKGNGWNRVRVRAFRAHRDIPVYRKGERQERGELSLREAAALLEVDQWVVRRLITTGVLAARQLCKGAPWVIATQDIEELRSISALSGYRGKAADRDQREFEF